MDEKQLKKLLQDIEVPPADENAKKRALNLASAEFEAHQKEKEKKVQGKSIFFRLMKRNPQDWREKMEKKNNLRTGLIYLTAGVALFTLPFAYEPMYQTIGTSATSTGAPVASQEALVPHQYHVSKLDRNIAPAPILKDLDDARAGRKNKEEMKTAARQQAPAAAKPMEGLSSGLISPVSPMVMAEPEDVAPQYYKDVGRDKFEDFEENPVMLVTQEPVSTFSVDVDTASYSFVRGQIMSGVLPQKDAVRTEEMINYFDYDYPVPESREAPFAHHVLVTPSPWHEGRKLVHIGIKGFEVQEQRRSNLVFLLDVSGSMNSPDKLPLVKNALKLMLGTLSPDDTVAIVVYAGAAGTVLEPTKVSEKHKIVAALDKLSAGGSTAGAEGIRQAYNLAELNKSDDAVNRVILATDGDFNVGITNRDELQDFVERKRESGVYLSVLGFGRGNYNDHLMQTLAQNGNGVAAYIDNLNEARKVLVTEASSSLFPIAQDVKIQVEFNPQLVSEYRLVGYETRHLNREDFNNDAVDAGDIGSGHTVTAIYEIAMVDGPRTVDPLRYGAAEQAAPETSDKGSEYGFIKMRYKLPGEKTSKLITTPITAALDTAETKMELAAWQVRDTGWATAVASFAQLLKGGKYTGTMSYDDIIALAQENKGDDPYGYRAEFINMVRLAKNADAMQKN
jgi:Ca-activated chloride channel family protein